MPIKRPNTRIALFLPLSRSQFWNNFASYEEFRFFYSQHLGVKPSLLMIDFENGDGTNEAGPTLVTLSDMVRTTSSLDALMERIRKRVEDCNLQGPG